MNRTEKVTFLGAQGHELVGRLELPSAPPRAAALFAHCFTCSKDVLAASRISRALAERGIVVLRFDFTGLGGSGGDFANTNFSSNVQDLVAAATYLRKRVRAPDLLVGHSLGGAAVLVAAHEVPECKVVATVGAPSDAAHVKHLLRAGLDDIHREGEAAVSLGGRTFTIKRQFLDDLDRQRREHLVSKLGRALLIFHSPTDAIVGIDNAREIYESARHPKSFIALHGADHLLSNRQDADYVGGILGAWASRYLSSTGVPALEPQLHGQALVQEAGVGKFQQNMRLGPHAITADEPAAFGGDDAGPSPYELLLGALGSCTAMTVRMYAERKSWPLGQVTVHLAHDRRHAEDCERCEQSGAKLDHIAREITLRGELSSEQRQRLMEIANRCPVHRTLCSDVVIETSERLEPNVAEVEQD